MSSKKKKPKARAKQKKTKKKIEHKTKPASDRKKRPDKKNKTPILKKTKKIKSKSGNVKHVKKRIETKKKNTPARQVIAAAANQPPPIPYQPQIVVNNLTETPLTHDFSRSVRFAWIGAGLCGSRIVKAFYDLGYENVVAVNTNARQLGSLPIPEDRKFLIRVPRKTSAKGALAAQVPEEKMRELLHLVRWRFGTRTDHIMVCFSAAGATAELYAGRLIDVAKDYARSIGKTNPTRCVGVFVVLPGRDEMKSTQIAAKTIAIINRLAKLAANFAISPLVVVANEKLVQMCGREKNDPSYLAANNAVANLFDIFNRLSAFGNAYEPFDLIDYYGLLRAGAWATMATLKPQNIMSRPALAEELTRGFKNALLTEGFDSATAKSIACIAVGNRCQFDQEPRLVRTIKAAMGSLSHIFPNAVVHHGLYADDVEYLRVYLLLSGLKKQTK